MSGIPRELLAPLIPNQTQVDLYVRDADGDDANNGRSTSAPLKTVQAAVDKIPRFVSAPVIIHIDDGTYDTPIIPQTILCDQVILIGDGAGSSNDGFTELLASTAAAASTDDIVVKTSGLTVDVYRGKTIEFLDGAAQGQRRTIRNNTATDIHPCYHFDPAPSPGDSYRIVEPAVKFDSSVHQGGGDDTVNMFAGSGPAHLGGDDVAVPCLMLVNLKWEDAAQTFLRFYDAHLQMFGIEAEDPGANSAWAMNMLNGSMMFGTDSSNGDTAFTPTHALGVADEKKWCGWGFNRVDVGGITQTVFSSNNGSVVGGHIVAPEAYVGFSQSNFISGGNIWGTPTWDAVTLAGGSTVIGGKDGLKVLITPAAGKRGIVATGGADRTSGTILGADINGNTAPIVLCEDGAIVRCAGGSFDFSMEGESASGPSIHAKDGGVIEVTIADPEYGRSGDADFQVGDVAGITDKNRAFFNTVGATLVSADGSRIKRP